MVGDVVVCVNDKTLVHMEKHLRNLLYCQMFDSVAKTFPAAVDFVNQSWKKEGKCFGQRSHCDSRRCTWALGLANGHRRDVYIG